MTATTELVVPRSIPMILLIMWHFLPKENVGFNLAWNHYAILVHDCQVWYYRSTNYLIIQFVMDDAGEIQRLRTRCSIPSTDRPERARRAAIRTRFPQQWAPML